MKTIKEIIKSLIWFILFIPVLYILVFSGILYIIGFKKISIKILDITEYLLNITRVNDLL